MTFEIKIKFFTKCKQLYIYLTSPLHVFMYVTDIIPLLKLTKTHFSRMQTTILLNSMGCIIWMDVDFSLDVTLTLICDLDLINEL